jgi:hypothetical protein
MGIETAFKNMDRYSQIVTFIPPFSLFLRLDFSPGATHQAKTTTKHDGEHCERRESYQLGVFPNASAWQGIHR